MQTMEGMENSLIPQSDVQTCRRLDLKRWFPSKVEADACKMNTGKRNIGIDNDVRATRV